eukprot:Clim_evm22s165 gene=Clim_evmTU22s165
MDLVNSGIQRAFSTVANKVASNKGEGRYQSKFEPLLGGSTIDDEGDAFLDDSPDAEHMPAPNIIRLESLQDGDDGDGMEWHNGLGKPKRLPRSNQWEAEDSALDGLLTNVYNFYKERGFLSIILNRLLNLLTMGFVVVLTIVLTSCIDYSIMFDEHDFSRAFRFRPFGSSVILGMVAVICSVFWIMQVFQLLFYQVSEVRQMADFFDMVLQIDAATLPNLKWHEVCQRLDDSLRSGKLIVKRTSNLSGQQRRGIKSLSPMTIVNRIMRQDNFMVALFNRELLNFRFRLLNMESKPLLPYWLEWNIRKCVFDYVFVQADTVRPEVMKADRNNSAAAQLSRRMMVFGILNLLLAPVLMPLMLVYYFLRSAEQIKSQPSELGSRQWTFRAKWLFREFNELPHFCNQRLTRAYQPTMEYISSFPSDTTNLIANFTVFISGSFVALLTIGGIYDENFLTMHITEGRTVLWYLGVFTVILAGARALLQDENIIFEPESKITKVIYHTHYYPQSWHGREHTREIRAEMAELFEYKAVLFVEELFSVLITGMFMIRYSYHSKELIQFFHRYTTWKEDVGHVCTFAQFDFERHGNQLYGAGVGLTAAATEDQGSDVEAGAGPSHVTGAHRPGLGQVLDPTRDGKMEKSFINFTSQYPTWRPDDERGKQFLSNINDLSGTFKADLAMSEDGYISEEEMTFGAGSAGNSVQSKPMVPPPPPMVVDEEPDLPPLQSPGDNPPPPPPSAWATASGASQQQSPGRSPQQQQHQSASSLQHPRNRLAHQRLARTFQSQRQHPHRRHVDLDNYDALASSSLVLDYMYDVTQSDVMNNPNQQRRAGGPSPGQQRH